jgi:hypothetical protein
MIPTIFYRFASLFLLHDLLLQNIQVTYSYHSVPQVQVNPYLTNIIHGSIREQKFWSKECIRLKNPPKNFVEFYDKILERNQPIVIENANNIFGKKLNKWKDIQYLMNKYGNTNLMAAIFNTLDYPTWTKFGSTPYVDKRNEKRHNLHMGHNRYVTLKELLTFNETNRLLFAEQFTIFEAEHESNEDIEYDSNDGSPIDRDVTNSRISFIDLYNDWEKPSFYKNIRPEEVNLWLGKLKMFRKAVDDDRMQNQPQQKAGNKKISSLHYDPKDNIMLQLLGNKTFYMYHGFDTGHLYPEVMKIYSDDDPDDNYDKEFINLRRQSRRAGGAQDNFSPIDPLNPNYKKFPLSKHASLIKCVLHPGDALYMPSFTWHHVVSEGEDRQTNPLIDGLNMGVNVWFAGNKRFQILIESVIAMLQNGETEEHVLNNEIGETEEMGEMKNDYYENPDGGDDDHHEL